MKFGPTEDRILLKPTPPDNFRGGLEIQGEPKAEGTVVAVGPGVRLHNITLNVTGDVTPESMAQLKEVIELIERGRALNVKPGDYVMFGKYAGTKVMHNDEEHIIIREADVFGILTEQ